MRAVHARFPTSIALKILTDKPDVARLLVDLRIVIINANGMFFVPHVKQDETLSTCSVCLEPMVDSESDCIEPMLYPDTEKCCGDIAVLPCGHSFHARCIAQWFFHSEQCPYRCVKQTTATRNGRDDYICGDNIASFD